MMFLLDANVNFELRKAGDGNVDANVAAWLSGVDATSCDISVVTVMELELGILRVERRDVVQGARLRAWVDNRVLPEFSERTLPIDAAAARRCAQLHVPDPRPERDAYLAATSLTHGMTVVTRNVADFETTGVTLVNPWSSRR